MLIVFYGTPKNSENGVEPKFLLWIQGTNKRWTTGQTAECDRKNAFPVVNIFLDVNPFFLGRGLESPRAHFCL